MFFLDPFREARDPPGDAQETGQEREGHGQQAIPMGSATAATETPAIRSLRSHSRR